MVYEARDDKGLVMNAMFKNMNKIDTYSAQAYIPIPINKNIYFATTLMRSRKIRDAQISNDNKIWQYYLKLESNIILTKNLTFDADFSYINKEFVRNMMLKNYTTLNFSIKQLLLNKKLQISLSGTNILGQKRKLYVDDNFISRLVTMKSSNDSSRFALSVRYLFNSNTKVKTKHVKAFNTEERER